MRQETVKSETIWVSKNDLYIIKKSDSHALYVKPKASDPRYCLLGGDTFSYDGTKY